MKNNGKVFNSIHLEGLVYEHNLKLKEKDNPENPMGEKLQYITGTLGIATDNDCLNVVTNNFGYVTPTFKKSGSKNETFEILKNIIDGKIPTVMSSSKEEAGAIKIDCSLGLNDFYMEKDGKETLVSAKRCDGGFAHLVNKSEMSPEESRSTFDVDFLITGCVRKEADLEKELPEKLILRGGIFDFKKALLPVELTVLSPAAMDYFEGLEPSSSNPVFTHVRGKVVSTTVKKKIEDESAFGEPSVRIVESTNKDFVITWAAKEPYLWDDESGILASELSEKMQEREVYLAEVKKKADDFKANKNNAFTTATTVAATQKTYSF